MRIIGINGFKRSGKNTAFELARQFLPGAKIQQIGFADSLKCMALNALGFDRPDEELILLADSIKEKATISVFYEEPGQEAEIAKWHGQIDLSTLHDLTGREYFQHFGDRARARFGENFWIDQVLPTRTVQRQNQAESLLHMSWTELRLAKNYDADYLFITDLRYPNEADRIKALGGVVWEVIRPGIESDGHASEQPLPEELVDFTIINDGTLLDLQIRVGNAVHKTMEV